MFKAQDIPSLNTQDAQKLIAIFLVYWLTAVLFEFDRRQLKDNVWRRCTTSAHLQPNRGLIYRASHARNLSLRLPHSTTTLAETMPHATLTETTPHPTTTLAETGPTIIPFTRQFPAEMLREMFSYATQETAATWVPDRAPYIVVGGESGLEAKKSLTASSRDFQAIASEFRWERMTIYVRDGAHVTRYLTPGINAWLRAVFPRALHIVLKISFRYVTDDFFNFLLELLRSCRKLKHATLELDQPGPNLLQRFRQIFAALPINLRSLDWYGILDPRPDGEVFYALRRFTNLRTLIIRIHEDWGDVTIDRTATLRCMLDAGPIHMPLLEYLGFHAPDLLVVHPNAVWNLPLLSHWHTSIDIRLFTQNGISFPNVTHVNLSGYIRITTEMVHIFRNSIAVVFPALEHLAYAFRTNHIGYVPWHWITLGIPPSLQVLTLFPTKDTPFAPDSFDEEAFIAHLRSIPFRHPVTIRLKFYIPSRKREMLREFAKVHKIVYE